MSGVLTLCTLLVLGCSQTVPIPNTFVLGQLPVQPRLNNGLLGNGLQRLISAFEEVPTLNDEDRYRLAVVVAAVKRKKQDALQLQQAFPHEARERKVTTSKQAKQKGS